jgi:V8-like Glu-specific endopeptidase
MAVPTAIVIVRYLLHDALVTMGQNGSEYWLEKNKVKKRHASVNATAISDSCEWTFRFSRENLTPRR